jgi:catalase
VDGGAGPRFVGVRLGRIGAATGDAIDIEATLETMPASLWDAVVVDASCNALAKVGHAVEFVKDQFRHCKSMLVIGDASALLRAAGIEEPASDPGFLHVAPADAATRETLAAFIRAVGRHRHYQREADPSPV